MALEGGFFRRILRGPETGSGSGGDQTLEDREAVQKTSLRSKIDNLLNDESVEGQVRTAYEELRAALDGNSIKDSLNLVRDLLNEADRPAFDSLGVEYHIARDPDPVRVETPEVYRAAVDAPSVIAANPVVPEEARESAPRVEQRVELTGEENTRINARVEMILAAGSQKKKRERFEGLRGGMLAEHFDEVARRLEERGFVAHPPEAVVSAVSSTSVPEIAAAAPEVTPEAPIPAADNEPGIAELEQELANAFAQETPEQREERINAAVASIDTVFDTDRPEAERRLNDLHKEFSRDDYEELKMRLSAVDIHVDPPETEAEPVPVTESPTPPTPVAPREEIETAGIRSKTELDRKFGRSVASVGGERFWKMPNGDAVLFIPGEIGASQVAEGGVLKFRDTQDAVGPAYRYAGGEFTAMTAEEYDAYHSGVVRESRRLPRAPEAPQVERSERVRNETAEGSADVDPLFSAYTKYLKNTKKGMSEGRSFWESANSLDDEQQSVLIRTLKDEDLINQGLADTIINELGGARVRHAEEGAAEARIEGRRVARTLEGAKTEFTDLMSGRTDLQEAVDEIFPTLTRRNRMEFQTWLRSNPNVDQVRLDEVLRNGPRTTPRGVAPEGAPVAVPEAAPRAPRAEETRESREARERRELLRAIDDDLAKIRV